MKISGKVLFLLVVELLAGFGICVAYGFIYCTAVKTSVPALELSSAALYKFQYGTLLFFELVPAILASGIVIGYSWAFGRENIVIEKRFSQTSAIFLRNLICISILCTFLCFIASEIGTNSIKRAQENTLVKSKNITEYIALAQEAYNEDEYSEALFYAKSALELNQKHKEAAELVSLIEEQLNSDEETTKSARKTLAHQAENKNSSALSVPELMKKANECYEKEDFINAHYYASQVLSLVEKNDGNWFKAQKISSESWAKLGETKSFYNELSKEVFAQKKEAYEALANGDYSKAYYSFADLLEQYPKDYDIQNYYEQAKQKLSSRCFFMDETENLQNFEQFRNIYFSIDNEKGGKDLISIGGLTSVKATDGMLVYLRNFSVANYSKEGQLLSIMNVPYAKLISAPLANMSDEIQSFVSRNYKTQFVPYVFLKSVDREYEQVFVEPAYEYFGNEKEEFETIYVMPISFEQFSTLCDVSLGPDKINLVSLFNFVHEADKYGYSSEILSYSLLSRLIFPFILFACFIFCGTMGWHTRLLSKDEFRMSWLLLFPFLIAIAAIIIKILRYFAGLAYYALLGMAGLNALWIALAIMVVIIFLCAFRFASIRQ